MTLRGRGAGRHQGTRPSTHNRTDAHKNPQSLAACTCPETGSSQTGSGMKVEMLKRPPPLTEELSAPDATCKGN